MGGPAGGLADGRAGGWAFGGRTCGLACKATALIITQSYRLKSLGSVTAVHDGQS